MVWREICCWEERWEEVERESEGDLILRDYNKTVFLIKSNGQKYLSHSGKLFPPPTLNAKINKSLKFKVNNKH